MQGRLLPWYQNRYQSHPLNHWQAEFFIAKQFGFSHIEFILDYNDIDYNPLMNERGLQELKNIVHLSGVDVKSVCADYFMQAPLHSEYQKNSEAVLQKLISNCATLNIKDIIIPCVDESSLKDLQQQDQLAASINKLLPLATKHNINLNLETDLTPQEFKQCLTRFDSKHIKVNYDAGNSAALGFDAKEEFAAYGEHISVLHIKDRIFNNGPIKLGLGDVDFNLIFNLIKQYNFTGTITMQAFRDQDYIHDLSLVREQKLFIEDYLQRL